MDELKNGHYKTQLYAEDHDSRKKQKLIKGLKILCRRFCIYKQVEQKSKTARMSAGRIINYLRPGYGRMANKRKTLKWGKNKSG